MEKGNRYKPICVALVAAAVLSVVVFVAPLRAEAKSTKPGVKAEKIVRDLSGTVAETMNSGGYTYVLLDKKGTKTWVVVPDMKVKVGEKVTFQPGFTKHDFTSRTLNRSFSEIVFSGGPASGSGAGSASQTGFKPKGPKIDKTIKLKKAAGPNAYTVAEIFAKRASLNKENVVLRAKVVKDSRNIMGRNWVHLQDGTGTAAKADYELVAVSKDAPAVGEVVTVKGMVYKDKDFGSGYKYRVILEKASIKR
jgi:hypothetical protein